MCQRRPIRRQTKRPSQPPRRHARHTGMCLKGRTSGAGARGAATPTRGVMASRVSAPPAGGLHRSSWRRRGERMNAPLCAANQRRERKSSTDPGRTKEAHPLGVGARAAPRKPRGTLPRHLVDRWKKTARIWKKDKHNNNT